MRALPWVILLSASIGVPAQAAPGAATSGGPVAAALEALRGHPQRARAMLAAREGERADAAALVVLVSVALDAGDLREAGRLVARLRSLRPDAAEGRLLGALVDERRTHPRGDWIAAGLAALRKVSPLREEPPLLDIGDAVLSEYLAGKLPFPSAAARTLNAADGFLARWAWPRLPGSGQEAALVRDAVRMAHGDERPLVLVAMLHVLDSARQESPGARAEDVAAARRAILEKLRGAPDARLRLAGLAGRPVTEPVALEEVTALEVAMAGDLRPSLAVDYTDLRRVLEEVDPALAGGFAMGGAIRLVLPPPFLLGLGDRLERGGLSEPARERLASALLRVAELQQREGAFLTDLLASVVLTQAGDLRGDPSLKARADAIRRETEAEEDAHRCLHPLLRLPIRSLQRAWAAEVTSERALAQQASRFGLSCPEPRPPAGDGGAEPGETRQVESCPDASTLNGR